MSAPGRLPVHGRAWALHWAVLGGQQGQSSAPCTDVVGMSPSAQAPGGLAPSPPRGKAGSLIGPGCWGSGCRRGLRGTRAGFARHRARGCRLSPWVLQLPVRVAAAAPCGPCHCRHLLRGGAARPGLDRDTLLEQICSCHLGNCKAGRVNGPKGAGTEARGSDRFHISNQPCIPGVNPTCHGDAPLEPAASCPRALWSHRCLSRTGSWFPLRS